MLGLKKCFYELGMERVLMETSGDDADESVKTNVGNTKEEHEEKGILKCYASNV